MKTGLVITSIAAMPNAPLKTFSKQCIDKKINFYLIGDTKSPEVFELEGCDYFSIKRQESLSYKIIENLPKKNYARKNIGYLLAMQAGCEIIIESDDDNFPKENFFGKKNIDQYVPVIQGEGWVNIYKYFSDENIWPRGFPLNQIKKIHKTLHQYPKNKIACPIQQSLADDNPDVDAIYRLTGLLPIQFKNSESVALAKGAWCPFNTQCTTFFKEAFPLLYLPSTCSIRMTDIWKSFVAQRIAWENNWGVLFTSPTVYQDRNEHNLMIDFKDEMLGYLHNEQISVELENLNLKSGERHIHNNMMICYEKMVELGFIKKAELDILENWFYDLSHLNVVPAHTCVEET